MRHPLILASQSQARRRLLASLGLTFDVIPADLDETPQQGESAVQLVHRLAHAKAQAVARDNPSAIVIGADEVASVKGQILGKPVDRDDAAAQLLYQRGQEVDFVTGLCVINAADNRLQQTQEHYYIVYRAFSMAQLDWYLDQAKPYHCAGSLTIEGGGFTLCERMHGDDPSSLLGLPLLCLSRMLEQEGVLAYSSTVSQVGR